MREKKKYILETNESLDGYNAGHKAPSDILHILINNCGYKVLSINYNHYHKFLRFPSIVLIFIRLFFIVKKDSYILFQYPYAIYHPTILAMLNTLLPLLKKLKNVKSQAIIHDIDTFRGKDDQRRRLYFLKNCDSLIVHSEQMKQKLIGMGINSDYRILGLFDYLYDKGTQEKRTLTGRINFSGNLTKSLFLKDLSDILSVSPDVYFELYGTEDKRISYTEHIKYNGRFSPNDLSHIKGSWGLVWDGDSIEKLNSPLGEYQKLNSPHKASLYLCAGLPLIVSDESAIAYFVSENKIGITTHSLLDLQKKIESVSQADYQVMINNIKKISSALSTGSNISNCVY